MTEKVNLAALRSYRRQLEDVLRTEVARLEAAVKEAAEQRRRLEDQADTAARRHEESMAAGLSPVDMHTSYEAVAAALGAAQRAEARINGVLAEWEAKRTDLIEAARERRKIELLEERQGRTRRLLANRAEQHALDEAAGIRFLRRIRPGLPPDDSAGDGCRDV
ncbi:flagellar export protein FliJ [Candidatus Nitrospira bockiana]